MEKLNQALYQEMFDKYASGSVSHWEMDSVSFYSHEHELIKSQRLYDDFFKLPEEPEVDYTFTSKDGNEIKMYKLRRIIGTVIDKNKMKNTVTLLTPTGVVNVKVYKNLDNTVTAHWTDNSAIKLTIIAPNRDKAEEIYKVATDYFSHHIVEYSLEGDAGSTKANTYHIAKAKDSEGNSIEVVKVIDKGDNFVVEITNYAAIV